MVPHYDRILIELIYAQVSTPVYKEELKYHKHFLKGMPVQLISNWSVLHLYVWINLLSAQFALGVYQTELRDWDPLDSPNDFLNLELDPF